MHEHQIILIGNVLTFSVLAMSPSLEHQPPLGRQPPSPASGITRLDWTFFQKQEGTVAYFLENASVTF